MQLSATRHSSRTAVESTPRLACSGSGTAGSGSSKAVFVLAAGSGGITGGSISDESVNAAVTIGSASRTAGVVAPCEAGVTSAATAGSVTGVLIDPISAEATTIGRGSSAELTLAACKAGVASATAASVNGLLRASALAAV